VGDREGCLESDVYLQVAWCLEALRATVSAINARARVIAWLRPWAPVQCPSARPWRLRQPTGARQKPEFRNTCEVAIAFWLAAMVLIAAVLTFGGQWFGPAVRGLVALFQAVASRNKYPRRPKRPCAATQPATAVAGDRFPAASRSDNPLKSNRHGERFRRNPLLRTVEPRLLVEREPRWKAPAAQRGCDLCRRETTARDGASLGVPQRRQPEIRPKNRTYRSADRDRRQAAPATGGRRHLAVTVGDVLLKLDRTKAIGSAGGHVAAGQGRSIALAPIPADGCDETGSPEGGFTGLVEWAERTCRSSRLSWPLRWRPSARPEFVE
jgi:hypothetical protein